MSKYRIDQFIIINLSQEESILQNSSGITRLTHPQMIEFFLKIDQENRLDIDSNYLKVFFKDLYTQAKGFLLKSNIMRKIEEKEEYEKIIILTNNDTIFDSVDYNLITKESRFSVLKFNTNEDIHEYFSTITDLECMLHVVVLNPFDYHLFLESNTLMKNKNLKMVYCFAYNSKFYITNIFKKEWHNPCPKCFFSQLEASLRSKNKNSDIITFQTIVDLIYSKNIKFSPELPLTKANILGLIQCVSKFDNMNMEENSTQVITVDLNGYVEYDQAIHWELCDCIY